MSAVAATDLTTTPRQQWRRIRGPLLIAGIIVLTGVVYAILTGRTTGGPMDPRSAQDHGARALAVLLGEQGVEVERVERLNDALDAAGPDATLLITIPGLLTREQAERIGDAGYAHLVLFEPGETFLTGVAGEQILPAGTSIPSVQEPGCDLRAAVRAGPVDVRGRMYRALGSIGDEAVQVCYGDSVRGAVVRRTGPDGRVLDVVGTPTSFSNAELAVQGNAALAMNLLGEQRRLVWYIPSPADIPAPGESGDNGAAQAPPDIWAMLPDGVRLGIGAAAVAVVLLMIAAARRLGPVVPEALPVVVRASEAAEGRARLYRRFRARDRAAAALVQATRARLVTMLALPPTASDDELAALVEARTGRPAQEVARLLSGRVPGDDGELIRLADALDELERALRSS